MALSISQQNVPGREEKIEQLERILQSRTFQGSESLKAFLRFVVMRAVNEQDMHLKEYTIATEVFGRHTNYDSRVDSVVRVQAGRLRTKIHGYYTTEGRDDRIIIDLPKGHYYPVFSYVEMAHDPVTLAAVVATEAPITIQPSTDTTAPPPPDSRVEESRPSPAGVFNDRARLAIIGLLFLTTALGLATVYYRSEAKKQTELFAITAAPATNGAPDWAGPLWNQFLISPQPILVAYSNTLFQGRAETGMKVLKSFDALGQDSPSASATQKSVTAVDSNGPTITDHYTGVGEVMGVYLLGDFLRHVNHSFKVKRSLLMTWDDFKSENIIILGSPAENLLLRDFPRVQDFVFKTLTDAHNRPKYGIANLRPRPREQSTYMVKEEGSSTSQYVEDYATVSMLRGIDGNRKLWVLAGITTFGTQAAVEYVTKPEYVKEMISRLNTNANPQSPVLPSNYQVLLKVQVKDGVPVQISYVTHHVLE